MKGRMSEVVGDEMCLVNWKDISYKKLARASSSLKPNRVAICIETKGCCYTATWLLTFCDLEDTTFRNTTTRTGCAPLLLFNKATPAYYEHFIDQDNVLCSTSLPWFVFLLAKIKYERMFYSRKSFFMATHQILLKKMKGKINGLETHSFFQEKPYMHYTGSSSATLLPNWRRSRETIGFTYVCLVTCIFCNGWDTRLHIPKQVGLPRKDSDSLKEGSLYTNVYLILLTSCENNCIPEGYFINLKSNIN